ncbi:uncharacterized protein LOC128263675 isoform X2 [Drosophila gunungcola]|uniref:uncharacterized protein LOC128263675 isoform X2 n=1 Tax=Drosophila gunungcola TaxID=103775 RepID=UPI0022DF4144|nr:uncharacterized protein LOC128263675 isoform X2 [Drosophila gunungcola]
MPAAKLKMQPRREMVGEYGTVDSRYSANVPKMELLKVSYVHQCKNAIMHRLNEQPLPAGGKNSTCFVGYCRQTGRNLSPNSFRSPLVYLKPPIADSCEFLLQPTQKRGLIPMHKHKQANLRNLTKDASVDLSENLNTFSIEGSTDIEDNKKSHSWKYKNHLLTVVSGIKSRADRIARIEKRKCSFHLKPSFRNQKQTTACEITRPNQSVPEWMFKNPGIFLGDGSVSSKCSINDSTAPPEQNFRFQQMKQYKKEQLTQPAELSRPNYRDESYDYKLCSIPQSEEGQSKAVCKDKRFSPKSCFDFDVTFSEEYCQQQRYQQSKTIHNEKRFSFKNIEKQTLVRECQELNGSIQTKAHGDPNDLQNFLKKNLSKATTHELLKAAAENTKKCNIELERRLNDFTEGGKKSTFNERSIPYNDTLLSTAPKVSSLTVGKPYKKNDEPIFTNEISELRKPSRPYSINTLSSDSMSLSGCGKSCRDNSSVCSSEDYCFECIEQKYSKTAFNCHNAVEGVFWNTAYDDLPTVEITANCCCSLSYCDKDDCSFLDENLSVDIKSISVLQSEASGVDEHLTRNKKLPLKDVASRRFKRDQVLKELLETERIYVNEMRSILKGYCDRLKSDDLAPETLQGNEDILFGNLQELYTFHNDVFLKDLENCISTTELVALCFVQRRDTFFQLYSLYCQNIPRSERFRQTLVDTHLFLQDCQKRLGHKLPLAAYLLKPVQRITKYQLLLKDLLRFSDNGNCTMELEKALDCMLIVLKCVNDSMHQVAISGFPTEIALQGNLLLQNSFQVWTGIKKDICLRTKPQQRHIFLYQKSMLFCKQTSKPSHNKSTYQFKNHLKMSQIGLTESLRGEAKRFEVWFQGRQEVYTLQATTVDIKQKWVSEIKRLLLNQLEELKGEKIKQHSLKSADLRQRTSWDTPNIILGPPNRTTSSEESLRTFNRNIIGSIENIERFTDKDQRKICCWSSDCSNSEDELSLVDEHKLPDTKQGARLLSLQ